jgi:hypothetical protein
MVATILVERMGVLEHTRLGPESCPKLDNLPWATKSPLLANVWPGCRLTVVGQRALMVSGLWTAVDRNERSTASTGGSGPPTVDTGPASRLRVSACP